MIPTNHLHRLEEVLGAFPIRLRSPVDRIRAGLLVPDFGVLAVGALQRIEMLGAEPPDLFHELLAAGPATDLVPGGAEFLFRSRHGDLVDLHATAAGPRDPARRTWRGVLQWARFYADLATGRRTIEPSAFLASTGGDFAERFTAGMIRLRDVVGTADPSLVPAHATGCLVHLLQDFHSASHVQLDSEGRALRFHPAADRMASVRHRIHDVDPRHASILLRRTAALLECIVDGNPEVDGFFPLLQEAGGRGEERPGSEGPRIIPFHPARSGGEG